MLRYGCFETGTVCSSCGNPVPINGPSRRLTCTSCFEEMELDPDILAGFLNDFEDGYEGFANGQGEGGTLMSGSGTFKYGYWKLAPRCSNCKTVLSIPEDTDNATVKCSKCDAVYYVQPVPSWLSGVVPSAKFFVTSRQQPSGNQSSGLQVNEGSQRPVVMSCPGCGAALSIMPGSERILDCKYCNSQVFIPDAVWNRLHPVKKKEEWFAAFEGKSKTMLDSARRLRDQKEETKELKVWKLKNAPAKAGNRFRPVFQTMGVLLVVFFLAVGIMLLIGYQMNVVHKFVARFGVVAAVIAVTLAPVVYALRTAFSAATGKGKACKKAMAILAEKHGWKHSGAEYKSSLGYIRAGYRGRDIEIDPGDDYAIEVEINESPFYLCTHPPGYPVDGLQRFTTGDSRFDSLFPIRYATPELVSRMESSAEEAQVVLAPLYWFMDRWEKKLGRFHIDWSKAGAHLKPGHMELMDTGGRYLPAEDLEPLLEDLITLAAAVDAVSQGRDHELPV